MSGLRHAEDWFPEEHDEVLWYQDEFCLGLGIWEDYPEANQWHELPRLDDDQDEEDRRVGRELRTTWAEKWRYDVFRQKTHGAVDDAWAILEPAEPRDEAPLNAVGLNGNDIGGAPAAKAGRTASEPPRPRKTGPEMEATTPDAELPWRLGDSLLEDGAENR